MRIQGTLSQWNEESSSGAITPVRGGSAVPVQISAFARNQAPPLLNERLSFELALDKQGNARANDVRYVDRSRAGRRFRLARPATARGRKRLHNVAAWALVAASAAYSVSAYLVAVSAAAPSPETRQEPSSKRSAPQPGLLINALGADALR